MKKRKIMVLQPPIKLHSFAVFTLAITAFIATSCGDMAVGTKEKKVFHDIVEYKWAEKEVEPQLDGLYIPDVDYLPGVDYSAYFAFNSDSTVDFFGRTCQTGLFRIDGNMVTCLFVEKVLSTDSITADDGDFNSKYLLKYKDNRLYECGCLKRNKDNEWVSQFRYGERYYHKAGLYTNKKYNLSGYGIGKDNYDTTVDAMAVVERYNLRRETYYMNGRREGLCKIYRDGALYVLGTYTDGMPSGTWTIFYPHGTIAYEISNFQIATDNWCHAKYIADAKSFYGFGRTDINSKQNGILPDRKVYFNDETGSMWKYWHSEL